MRQRGLLLLAALAPLVSSCADVTAPRPAGSPPVPAVAQPARGVADGARVEFKLRPALGARVAEGALRDRSGRRLEAVEAAIARRGGGRPAPLFRMSAAQVDGLARAAAARGEPVPALGSWHEVTAADPTSAALLAGELAYVAPAAAPPPALGAAAALFTALSYTDRQLYFAAAPEGTGIVPLRGTVPGADGAGVTVVDLEYNWTWEHEDVQLTAAQAHLGGDTHYYPSDHGTAVLGVLGGRANEFGVTGGAPAATIRTVSPYYNGVYSPADQIMRALLHMRAGDVLLIEQQTWGPDGAYVPLEWTWSVYESIGVATRYSGVVVVEAAGNGSVNLDQPMFGGRFDRSLYNSGAIIVGAGGFDRSAYYFSSYGSRVDVHARGGGVTTTGYGDLAGTTPLDQYTASFGGTSSASAIVAATAAALQGYVKATQNRLLTPAEMAAVLRETGTPQAAWDTRRIGPLPNLDAAIRRVDESRQPTTAVVTLALYNADTDQPVPGYEQLRSGATLDLAALPTRNLNVRAITTPGTVGSVRFGYDANASYHTETYGPYFLAGDDGSWTPTVGSHTLTATPYSEPGGGGAAGTPMTVTFTVVAPPAGPGVSTLALFDADTRQPIAGYEALGADVTLDLAQLPTRRLNVRAVTDPAAAVGSVRFGYNGNPAYHTETYAPYFFAGDDGAWTPTVGTHTVTATAHTGAGATGAAGAPRTLTLRVTDSRGQPAGPAVASLTLFDADTRQPIPGYEAIPSGATLNLATLPTRNLNVRANTTPGIVGSVRFGYDGAAAYHTETYAPYFLAGDDGRWTPAVGSHTLTATAYTGSGATGTAGPPLTVTFTVTDAAPSSLAGAP